MRVLFDQATPVPIRPYLEGHDVRTAAQQGWDTLKNGELLAAAETDGFDVLLTTDKNMRYQQNLAGRKIAVVVLGQQQWPSLRTHVQRVVERAFENYSRFLAVMCCTTLRCSNRRVIESFRDGTIVPFLQRITRSRWPKTILGL